MRQEHLPDSGFLLPWFWQDHVTVFNFKNKEYSSCSHIYYAKTDKKRIFVNYPLILFDILIPSLIRRRIAVFSVLLTLQKL